MMADRWVCSKYLRVSQNSWCPKTETFDFPPISLAGQHSWVNVLELKNCGNWRSDGKKKHIESFGNVTAKCHHQLGVGCMISHVRSIMWWNISEQTTCTQESRGKAISSRLATILFGKWLKKPFLTQMLQRLIDLMRTGLFCERNFHRPLVYMEGMGRYVFLWHWSTTSQTEKL